MAELFLLFFFLFMGSIAEINGIIFIISALLSSKFTISLYSDRGNLKKLKTLRLSVDGKLFENGIFRKRLRDVNHLISLPGIPQT